MSRSQCWPVTSSTRLSVTRNAACLCEGAGQGDALALPPRQQHAALAHKGVVALGQGGDEAVCVGHLGSRLDVAQRGVPPQAVPYVVGHRACAPEAGSPATQPPQEDSGSPPPLESDQDLLLKHQLGAVQRTVVSQAVASGVCCSARVPNCSRARTMQPGHQGQYTRLLAPPGAGLAIYACIGSPASRPCMQQWWTCRGRSQTCGQLKRLWSLLDQAAGHQLLCTRRSLAHAAARKRGPAAQAGPAHTPSNRVVSWDTRATARAHSPRVKAEEGLPSRSTWPAAGL